MSVQIIINGENAKETLFELFGLSEGLFTPVSQAPEQRVGDTLSSAGPVKEAQKTRKRTVKAEPVTSDDGPSIVPTFQPIAPETVEAYEQPWVNEAPEVLEPATLEEIHELVAEQEALYDDPGEDEAAFDSVVGEEPEAAEPPVFITKEELRERMLELSRTGGKDVCKQIIMDCGVTQLGDIPPARYADAMEAVKVAMAEIKAKA